MRQRIATHSLQLIGWWFDIATGEMHAWRERDRSFVLIDRTFADGAARKAMLAIFDILGLDSEVTKDYQRRLSGALF